MTKRTLDKKIIKISFLESSDEIEEQFSRKWRLNCSSDDETFLRNKSEVLWSRDNSDSYLEKDFFQEGFDSFSDLTGRTVSSCSWHNDEFDMQSMRKVNASLEAIEDALYERKKAPFISEDVFQECCDWSDKFAYLRLKGEQIVKPVETNVFQFTESSKTLQLCSEDLSNCLQIEGQKLAIHSPDGCIRQTSLDRSDNVLNYLKDILDEDCEYEEYLAVDNSDDYDDVSPNALAVNESTVAATSYKTIEEKIIDRLASEVWPNVLTLLQTLNDKQPNAASEDFQLPPIATAEQQKPFCLQRPKTEGMSMSNTEFPKLNSILSVSPKVLQKKAAVFGRNGRVIRPNSEMSLFSRNRGISHFNKNESFKTSKSKCLNNSESSIHGQSKYAYSKTAKTEDKESENFCLFLPALEEDIQDSSNILRGFHIEPELREVPNRTFMSSRDDYEAKSSSTRKHECFLPPIINKGHLPSNMKLTRNLFTFYGSHSKEGSRLNESILNKQEEIGSRRNTSASRKVINSQECTQQKPADEESSTTSSLLHAFIGRKR